mmetsp:Transcript_50303/g.88504  ORF Transcript_50303/g.88504 Transcript_50303/m.88504 type:complete len:166 (-) Transcript_50303:82-579(-)
MALSQTSGVSVTGSRCSSSRGGRPRSVLSASASVPTLPSIEERETTPFQAKRVVIRPSKSSFDPCRHLRLSPLQWGHASSWKTSYTLVTNASVEKSNDPKWSTELRETEGIMAGHCRKAARQTASVPGSQMPDAAHLHEMNDTREKRARSMRAIATGKPGSLQAP